MKMKLKDTAQEIYEWGLTADDETLESIVDALENAE
jgi:hypothetical protein